MQLKVALPDTPRELPRTEEQSRRTTGDVQKHPAALSPEVWLTGGEAGLVVVEVVVEDVFGNKGNGDKQQYCERDDLRPSLRT